MNDNKSTSEALTIVLVHFCCDWCASVTFDGVYSFVVPLPGHEERIECPRWDCFEGSHYRCP